MIIEWRDIHHYPQGTQVTFRIGLDLNTYQVFIYCQNCQSNGRAHTQGMEDKSGTLATGDRNRMARSWSVTDDLVGFTPNTSWIGWTP